MTLPMPETVDDKWDDGDIPVALTCDVCNLKHVDDDALLWCLNDHAHGNEGVTLECRCPTDRVLAREPVA